MFLKQLNKKKRYIIFFLTGFKRRRRWGWGVAGAGRGAGGRREGGGMEVVGGN